MKDDEDRYGLALTARRNSWGPNYVRFGLNLQDDFEGNSSYNAAARFVLSEITQPGGEWVWDLQVGETSRIATEVYLPISQSAPYFFLPHAQLEARNVAVLDESDRPSRSIACAASSYGSTSGASSATGARFARGCGSETRQLARARRRSDAADRRFRCRAAISRALSYDRLDDVNFPRHGTARDARMARRARRAGFGADARIALAFDWIAARSFGRQTAVLWTSLGTALE